MFILDFFQQRCNDLIPNLFGLLHYVLIFLIPFDTLLFIERISFNQIKEIHQQLNLLFLHVNPGTLNNLMFKLTYVFLKCMWYELKLILHPQYNII